MKTLPLLTAVGVVAAAAAVVSIGAFTLESREAQATPKFTQETGKACTFCHTAPPTLNDQGKKFKANGNKL